MLAVRPGQAGSFAINEQSVSGLGTAYAGGAAYAADASGMFFNPALIGTLEDYEVNLGIHYIIPFAEFNDQGSTNALGFPQTGNNGRDGVNDAFFPNFFFSAPVIRNHKIIDVTLGFGLTGPFALQTNYDPHWVGRYQALRSKVLTLDMQPTLAIRLFDRLSIGVGLDIQYASARLSNAVDFGSAGFAGIQGALAGLPIPAPVQDAILGRYAANGFTPGGNDGTFEVNGDDWSLGWTIGATLEYLKDGDVPVLNEGRIGVSFRSGITHDIEGDIDFRDVPLLEADLTGLPLPPPLVAALAANETALQDLFFSQSGSAQLNLPEIYRFSIYQRFAKYFALMGDITWTRWERLQQVAVIGDSGITPITPLEVNYEDALRYAVGLEIYPTETLTLRFGFAYDETPIRSAEFRTPRIPDSDRIFLSAGIRWSPTRWMDIDVGYAHLFVNDPQVDQVDSFGNTLVGEYDASVDIVSAAVTLRWGGPKEEPPPAPDGKSYSKSYVK
jgi:long-chain fatty acid transport protein